MSSQYWVSIFTCACFNIKMSYLYRNFHCGDHTTVSSCYLRKRISYIGKTTSLYCNSARNTSINLTSPIFWSTIYLAQQMFNKIANLTILTIIQFLVKCHIHTQTRRRVLIYINYRSFYGILWISPKNGKNKLQARSICLENRLF